MPSLVWVLIFVIGIVAFIGTIITVFFLIGTVPGVVSAIFLVPGLMYVMSPRLSKDSRPADSIAKAIGIGFFALMGMAVDQTGNYVYNYPLRYLCPEGTSMGRSTNISHPLPGRTDLTQDYACYDSNDKRVKQISLGYVIGLRFVEYIVLAYALIGLRALRLQALQKK